MNSVHRLLSVAVVEWKLQVRTVVFWAGLAVLLLYTLGQAIGIPPEMAFLSRQWMSGREDSLAWLSIVLIFLVPSSLARDRRTAALVWTAPVTGSIYAAGKLLGVWLTALTLAGIELTAQFSVRALAWERLTPGIVSMLLTSISGWLIGIFYIASLYFLLTVLVRGRALAAYTLNILYFVTTFSVKDVANPFSLIPSPVFRSDLVGDGPESPLFHSHYMLYLSLAAVTVMCTLLIYPRLERRSLFQKDEKAVLLSGLILSLSVAGWMGSVFARDAMQIIRPIGLSSYPPSLLTEEDLQSVHVTARFEPEQGLIEGNVELVFKQPLENVTLYIPAGLELSTVTDCQTHVLQITRLDAEWAKIVYAPQMCITFDGTWRANRASYQHANIKGPEEFDLNVGAYIGQGYAYLTPTARWYPAPVGTYEWATPHTIQITVPRALTSLVSPETTVDPHSEWMSYAWQSHRGRPLITMIVGKYREIALPGGETSWVSPEHQHVALQTTAFYLAFLKPFDRLVGHEATTYQIVETPVLRWPIISGQFVLLPERYFFERLSSSVPTEYDRNVISLGLHQAFQQEMYRTARGWLQGHFFFADPALTNDIVTLPAWSPDPFSLYVPLREALAHYLSLQLLDQRFGTDRLDEVMEARIRYSDQYLHDPELRRRGGGIEGELPVPPYERSWAFNQMFAAIGQLERRVGRAQVNQMISLLRERHSGRAITTADWLEIINEVAGAEARQEFESTCIVQVLQEP